MAPPPRGLTRHLTYCCPVPICRLGHALSSTLSPARPVAVEVFAFLYDAGYESDHMKEQLFARVPTAEEAKLLQLPPGESVVELHRTTFTADG